MVMPGRSYSVGSGYRYGFNGKENDNDISEGGQDYGMRIYDGRLGRFLSVDPLSNTFPWYTPYQFAGNKPIAKIDLDGLEEASPAEKQRATSYLQTVKPYIKNNPHVFQNISPDKLNSDLASIVNNPGSMTLTENPANFCGIYAFTYIYLLFEPTRFIENVAGLYIKGSTKMGDIYTVSAGTDIRGAKQVEENHSTPAFVFGASVRSTFNGWLSYDGNAPRFWGSTNSGTMKHWLTKLLGVNVSEFDYGHENLEDGITPEDLVKLQSHLNSGKQAVLRVNYLTYASNNGKGYDPYGDIVGGDHWVVLNGKMTIDEQKSTVTFSAYDNHQGLVQKTFSKSDFMDMINHVLMVDRKPKTDEKIP